MQQQTDVLSIGLLLATLTYTVDGTAVVKNVTRQLWRYENLSGKHYGSWISDSCAGWSGSRLDEPITIDVAHNADNTVQCTSGALLFPST